MPTVRQASRGDRAAVVKTVVAAFDGDPAWAFLMDGLYAERAPRFAEALFDSRIAAGTIWVTEDLASVAMWNPPSEDDAPQPGVGEIWARYRDTVGPQAFNRLTAYNDAVKSASSREDPHWYLGVLATHPLRQREGLASAVLEPALSQADQTGICCYLETSTEHNRSFYKGRRFTDATPLDLPGGPPTWWMRCASAAR